MVLLDVMAGETYFLCTCGQSKRFPLCDGSHKGSGFRSLPYTALTSKTIGFKDGQVVENPEPLGESICP